MAGRRHVRTLMHRMGVQAIYRKHNTSKKDPGHKVYPYLLRQLAIDRANQVWAMDITYVPIAKGLTVVLEWYSRKVLAWRLSILPGVKLRSRVLNALNFLPSIATMACEKSFNCRHIAMERWQTRRIGRAAPRAPLVVHPKSLNGCFERLSGLPANEFLNDRYQRQWSLACRN